MFRPHDAPRPRYVAIIFIALMHVLALWALVGHHWYWPGILTFYALYEITGKFGICVIYHRCITHGSFLLPRWFERIGVTCGALAMQGTPEHWTGTHNLHHANTDTPRDPTWPGPPSDPLWRRFWRSHLGWILIEPKEDYDRYAPARFRTDDRHREKVDPYYYWLTSHYLPLQVLQATILYAIGGLPLFLWGFAFRIVFVWHCTWFVNSATHLPDGPADRAWVSLLTGGEGEHWKHHTEPGAAGWAFWRDQNWYTIRLLESLGLATRVRRPVRVLLS